MSSKYESELLAWHAEHGRDIPKLLEERADLFRLLKTHPQEFQASEVARKFVDEVAAMAALASQVEVYKKVFSPEHDALSEKEEQSLGLVADPDDDD